MNYYEALSQQAEPVDVTPSETSYFSEPSKTLDPKLFTGDKLRPYVRDAILSLLYNHLKVTYREADAWTNVYLAGSGVSYNWSANRNPADLDCLISVDYIQFRQANQSYKGWSDAEISAELNQGFSNQLHPKTTSFLNNYDLTFYVNLNQNIEEIKPYAAYSVLYDSWVVPPTELNVASNPEWEAAVKRDYNMTTAIVNRYASALDKVKNATNQAVRVSAETALANAIQQGSALYEDIHSSRRAAFSPSGSGHADFANYRWQAGKRSGAVTALKKLHSAKSDAEAKFSRETYGVELPDTATLLRRAYRQP